MQVHTGEIVSQEEINKILDPEVRKNYTPLSESEHERVRDLPPLQRVKTLSELRHTEKQIAKRRLANKRNKQSRKRR